MHVLVLQKCGSVQSRWPVLEIARGVRSEFNCLPSINFVALSHISLAHNVSNFSQFDRAQPAQGPFTEKAEVLDRPTPIRARAWDDALLTIGNRSLYHSALQHWTLV